jgi:hypothetical protein
VAFTLRHARQIRADVATARSAFHDEAAITRKSP